MTKDKFKKGQEVKLKKEERKWRLSEAWSINTVHPHNVLAGEANAKSYFVDMVLALGYSYKAKVIKKSINNPDVYYIEINAKGVKTREYLEAKCLVPVRGGKNK